MIRTYDIAVYSVESYDGVNKQFVFGVVVWGKGEREWGLVGGDRAQVKWL